ncbi:MAG: ABC transporter ATP-binding protein [Pusillimonas sp.]
MSFDNRRMTEVLKIQDLSLAFGGTQVLERVNLTLLEGEVLALIGPNGAGKSALLNCICGVYRPSNGSRIELGGRPVTGLPPHRVARLGLGRTFQGLNLIPDRTVLESILLGWSARYRLSLFGVLFRPFSSLMEERAVVRKAHEIMELCGVKELANQYCQDLSLGTLRRVDLARALISEPDLLLLDEPASGLSHEERPLIGEMVRVASSHKGLAVLWIEHDLDLVLSEADRAVVLHHGEVIDQGPPDEPEVRQRLVLSYKQGRRASVSDAVLAVQPA